MRESLGLQEGCLVVSAEDGDRGFQLSDCLHVIGLQFVEIGGFFFSHLGGLGKGLLIGGEV